MYMANPYKGRSPSIAYQRTKCHIKFKYIHTAYDVRESVHRDMNVKVTNKMQLYRLIYYSHFIFFMSMHSHIRVNGIISNKKLNIPHRILSSEDRNILWRIRSLKDQ
jgi:hypothetical protein